MQTSSKSSGSLPIVSVFFIADILLRSFLRFFSIVNGEPYFRPECHFPRKSGRTDNRKRPCIHQWAEVGKWSEVGSRNYFLQCHFSCCPRCAPLVITVCGVFGCQVSERTPLMRRHIIHTGSRGDFVSSFDFLFFCDQSVQISF